MNDNNLAYLAHTNRLTIKHIQDSTIERMNNDVYQEVHVIYRACAKCRVEIIETILNKEGFDSTEMLSGQNNPVC
jgi:hypothetical protein